MAKRTRPWTKVRYQKRQRLREYFTDPVPRATVVRDKLELKFFDVESVDDAFSSAWAAMEPATTNLTAVAQGDGESNRDGRKYRIHGIYIKGFIKINGAESATTPPPDVQCRICLVWDKQTNGAQLTATDVMDAGQTVDVFSFRNLQHTERFTVLYDRIYTIKRPQQTNEGAINLFASPDTLTPIKIMKTFKVPIEVNTDGTTADIANITTNSIHMIGVATASTPTLSYTCRLRFTG